MVDLLIGWGMGRDMDKVREVVEEFRTVVAGRVKVVDSILPPLLFVVVNGLAGADWAVAAALGVSLLLVGWRWLQGESLLYALLGLVGAAFAYLFVRLMGRAEGFFLPGIFTSGLTTLLAVVSILARRPLVAWSSVIARRWPLGWYWHPRVRPAYAEVTWLWAIFFGAHPAPVESFPGRRRRGASPGQHPVRLARPDRPADGHLPLRHLAAG